MRTYAPSLLALAAGTAWVVVATTLMPASESGSGGGSAAFASIYGGEPASCSAPAMVATLPDLSEASGLAVSRRSPQLLWAHNDSGRAMLFGLGVDGAVRARVEITGMQVDDWEDVSTGPCPQGSCVYMADIGDNGARRSQIAVYRVAEPAAGDTATPPVEVFAATYPDGAHDAEAVFVTRDGAVFVITKGETGPVSVYRYPAPLRAGGTSALERVTTLTAKTGKDGRITDADLSWDGQWVAIRTTTAVAFYRTADLIRGAASTPLVVDLAGLREPQGEGVAMGPDGVVYLAGERGDGHRGGTLARMSCKLPH